MLPMVIYITNDIITDWGNPSLSHLGSSIALAQIALYIIWICGLELHSICFKKCTHAMAIGYFLQYTAYDSQPGITALAPICSLYQYLAATITFLYPLATKLFTVYAYWYLSCLLFITLTPKPLFQSLYPGLPLEEHQLHQNQFFILNLHYFWMVSLSNRTFEWKQPSVPSGKWLL